MRELRKELGIAVVAPMEPIARIQGPDFRNDIWHVDAWIGQPSNRAPEEQDDVKWFDAERVKELQLADSRIITLLDATER